MQSLKVSGVHSVVVDESQLASKVINILAYDANNVQLLAVELDTDSTASSLVTVKAPAPATPSAVTLTPATANVADNAATGTKLATVAVQMSDGSAFSGQLAIATNNMAGLSGSNVVLTRGLSASDDGSHPMAIKTTQNGVSKSATLTVAVSAAAPPPAPHTVVVGLAEDAYQGDAKYSLTLDGVQVATGTVTVLKSSGKSQDVSIPVADGNHKIVVTFLNDAYGGSRQAYRNLYVNYVKYDGVAITGATAHLWNTGSSLSVMVPPVVAAQPTPSSVTLTPSTVSIADNAASGATLAQVSVAMSDGSAFGGSLTIATNNMAGISGNAVKLTRALSASDDGSHPLSITATQNGASKSATLTVTVSAAAPPPPPPPPTISAITFNPSAPHIDDNAASGTFVANVAVQMSDGSPFSGAIAVSDKAGLVTASGMKIVTKRAATTADDGTDSATVTATTATGETMSVFFPSGQICP